MKIVYSGDKDKSTHFSELSSGDVFMMDGEVCMRASYESAVDMKTGDIYTIHPSQDVISLPNAELHLNK